MSTISKVTAALILGASISLFAADAAVGADAGGVTASAEVSIDAQIEQIKNSNPEQRRELMNKFKEELANMNREERMEAISKLREQMHAQNAQQAGEHANEHAQKGMEYMKDMAQSHQSMQMQHEGEMEQMHQMQGVDQYRESGSMGAGAGTPGQGGGSHMPFQGQRH